MRETTRKTLLFRQNVNRTNAEWARFLENYREDLIRWLMGEFGIDWHTAEDVVSEIFLAIIRNPVILNLRPDDSFRHTLIVLCRQKYTKVAKPWRRKLLEKVCSALRLLGMKRNTPLEEVALGYVDLVTKDLLDESKDNARSYVDYSPKDLERWRARWNAAPGVTPEGLARTETEKITASTFRKSCSKVDDAIAETVKKILERK